MPNILNSYWFPNFATKYKFYFESGIIPQPFVRKFWKIFNRSRKMDALEGKSDNDEMTEQELKEFIEKMEEFVRSVKPKDEKIQSYYYKDPNSLCEMKVKAVKVYESKVDIRLI